MTPKEREAFLADVHVGVVAVADEGGAPLTVPVWYSYEPRGEIRLVTGRTSRKGRLLERAQRFSLLAQIETPPYKCVSIEGPIIAIEAADRERDLRPLARRYLGGAMGDQYVESTRSEHTTTTCSFACAPSDGSPWTLRRNNVRDIGWPERST
jgi:nitroimidazol reductase NimA-like FMN-containing flavoprotein (pyridoxamine 5'-phosphate oxidase superfamily)